MRKFPKLKYPNNPETDGVLAGDVVVTEKLDGANFRFTIEQGDIVIGTRNNEFPIDDENIPKAFEHAVDWVRNLSDRQKESLNNAGTFFGEAMHYHSLKYQDVDYVTPQSGSPYFGEGYPNVVLFDWWNGDRWVHWHSFENLTSTLALPTTQVLDRGDGGALKDKGALTIPNESMFGGQPEGIVVRRIDGTVRAKKVSEDFKEQNAEAFNDPNKAAGAASKFVAAFVTDARVEKVANKLVDGGDYDRLQMPMMSDLPRKVLVDAMHENAWDLLTSGGFEAEWDDDFKADVRSKTSKKCARVLKTLCQEF